MCSSPDRDKLLSQQLVLPRQFALALPSDRKLHSVPLSPLSCLVKAFFGLQELICSSQPRHWDDQRAGKVVRNFPAEGNF